MQWKIIVNDLDLRWKVRDIFPEEAVFKLTRKEGARGDLVEGEKG